MTNTTQIVDDLTPVSAYADWQTAAITLQVGDVTIELLGEAWGRITQALEVAVRNAMQAPAPTGSKTSTCENCGLVIWYIVRSNDGLWRHRDSGQLHCQGSQLMATPPGSYWSRRES